MANLEIVFLPVALKLLTFIAFKNSEDIDWEKYWNPKIYVENNLGEPKETIWQTLMFNAKGEATIYERRRIKGCFLENLELDEFPFDTQVIIWFDFWFSICDSICILHI